MRIPRINKITKWKTKNLKIMAEVIDNGHVMKQEIPNGKINAGLTTGK